MWRQRILKHWLWQLVSGLNEEQAGPALNEPDQSDSAINPENQRLLCSNSCAADETRNPRPETEGFIGGGPNFFGTFFLWTPRPVPRGQKIPFLKRIQMTDARGNGGAPFHADHNQKESTNQVAGEND